MKRILKVSLRKTLFIYVFVIAFEAIGFTCCYTFTGIIRRDLFNKLQGSGGVFFDNFDAFTMVIFATLTPLIFNFCKYITGYLIWTAQQNIGNNLKEHIYKILFGIPLNRKTNVHSNELITRFRDDISDIVAFFTEVYDQFPKFFISLINLFIVYKINKFFFTISALPLLIIIFLLHLIQKRLIKNRMMSRSETDRTIQFLGDMLGSLDLIKLSEKKESYFKHYEKLCDMRAKRSIKDSAFQRLLSLFSMNVMSFAQAVILFFAFDYIKLGTFSIGDLILFEHCFWFFTDLPGALSGMFGKYKQMSVSVKRINDLDSDTNSDVLNANLKKLSLISGYKKGINLITGANGSGKSFLLKNIFSKTKLNKNGSNVCYLSQNPYLVSDTIQNNLCLGLDFDEQKINEVLEIACLSDEFCKGKLSLNTFVGNNGEKLSGGQIKRLALARLLYRDPEFVLLDDLTSGLDIVTERKILNNLKNLKEKTIILSGSGKLSEYAINTVSI